VQAFGDVPGDINILFGHHLNSPWIERNGGNPDAKDFNSAHPVMTGKALGHGAPAGIPGADKENAVVTLPAPLWRDYRHRDRV
jgi:hypothetical protein